MTAEVLHEPDEPAAWTIRGSVVVGVGPPGGDISRALWEASLWAARRPAEITLMSAVGGGRHHTGSAGSSEGSQRRRRALVAIHGAAHRLARTTDVNQIVHTHVVDQPPEQMLIKASTGAALIVVQRRRELRTVARLRIGSTTAAVAAHAACPTLIVHADDQICVGRGVVAVVDDRRSAGACLGEAFDEARYRGVLLTAVACQGRLCDSMSLAHSVSSTAHAASAADLAEQISGRQQDYPEVPVRQVTLDGPPIADLLTLARDSGLVVVSRHSRGQPGIRNLSTMTRELIEEARCPVLVVPVS